MSEPNETERRLAREWWVAEWQAKTDDSHEWAIAGERAVRVIEAYAAGLAHRRGEVAALELALHEACNWMDSIEKAATGGPVCRLCGEVFTDESTMGRDCPLPGAVARTVDFRALLTKPKERP